MENFKLKNVDSLVKVELNDEGDYITLSADSATFFDDYVTFCKEIVDLSDEAQKQINELEDYTEDSSFEEKIELAKKITAINISFSDKAEQLTDNLLGEGATRMYFRNLYENVKDFKPDAECFMDFIEQITPVIEACYGKKIEVRKNIDKKKVSKYQPQDFKKKGGK